MHRPDASTTNIANYSSFYHLQRCSPIFGQVAKVYSKLKKETQENELFGLAFEYCCSCFPSIVTVDQTM